MSDLGFDVIFLYCFLFLVFQQIGRWLEFQEYFFFIDGKVEDRVEWGFVQSILCVQQSCVWKLGFFLVFFGIFMGLLIFLYSVVYFVFWWRIFCFLQVIYVLQVCFCFVFFVFSRCIVLFIFLVVCCILFLNIYLGLVLNFLEQLDFQMIGVGFFCYGCEGVLLFCGRVVGRVGVISIKFYVGVGQVFFCLLYLVLIKEKMCYCIVRKCFKVEKFLFSLF